jgi:cytochrome P450
MPSTRSKADVLLHELRRSTGHHDRYLIYGQLRDLGPVVRSRWGLVVTGYRDCGNILRAHHDFGQFSRTYFSENVPGWATHESLVHSVTVIQFTDDPRHCELRTPTRSVLSADYAADLADQIGRRVDDRLDLLEQELRANGVADFMSVVAVPLAEQVVDDMLGISDTESRTLTEMIRAIIAGTSDLLRGSAALLAADAAAVELDAYVRELVAHRTGQPGRGPIWQLANDPRLSADDAVACVLGMIVPAVNNIPGMVGNALAGLDAFPEQRRLLIDRPAILDNAVEELLRFDAPVHVLFRRARVHTTLHDCEIKPGDGIFLLAGAANRDPDQWADPDVLRLDRDFSAPQSRPISFGYGHHACPGASLARVAMRVMLTRVYDRFPRLSVAGPSISHPSITFHYDESLPVTTGVRQPVEAVDR